MYTQKTHAVQYLLEKKTNIIESMNIALIVHFTPQTPRGQGQGLCSVKQWDVGKTKA